jgi:hypothetical protein
MKRSAFQRGLLLGVALLVGMPLSAAAKCGRAIPSQPQPIAYLIDGRQVTKAALDTVSPDTIHTLHIICWNPADSTFIGSHTGFVGVNVISIMTTGLVDRLVAELYRVSDAASSSIAAGPPTVRAKTDDEITVELTPDGTQWSATLKHGALAHRCVLDVGTPPPSMASERQRTCAFSIAEGEKYVLTTEG